MCLGHTLLIWRNQHTFILKKWGNDAAWGGKERVVRYSSTKIGCQHSLNECYFKFVIVQCLSLS